MGPGECSMAAGAHKKMFKQTRINADYYDVVFLFYPKTAHGSWVMDHSIAHGLRNKVLFVTIAMSQLSCPGLRHPLS